MLRKPRRPESDIERLAEELRSRVRFGDNVEAWMRRNVVKLTKLVRDQGWRWEDVGIAMTRAGITYSTGRPWTPEVLRVKASEARAQTRARRERANKPSIEARARSPQERDVLAVARSVDQAPPPPIQPLEPERPKFALAQLVHRHETRPIVPVQPAEQTTFTPDREYDVDAVMRRFFRTPPAMSEPMASKSDKVAPPQEASAGAEPASPPAFVFGSSYARVTPDIPIHAPVSRPKVEDTVVDGVDLSGKPKIIFLAGRGKTGKTTAIRWMSERALAAGRPLLMGDVDPGNISFGIYFEGVHEPPDRDSPLVAFKWLEEFVGHAIEHKQTAVIDLGGGDTTLRRLADELPDLATLAEESGVAIVILYFIGPQLEDLAPMAAMAQRAFRPQASAIVMNEAAVDIGMTREQAFGPVSRHALIADALRGGAVPVWMPRLLVADKIELLRAHFMQARDGARGPDGAALLGPFDRSRVRSWLEAMDRQFAGIRTWLP